ncbi:MAG: peptidoglycan DD-metalloendopeptidase family protein [Bacteroidetes bacterium]|nr:MAG: peptidoglycan DD-metalloendopeptidase family protein [Bacteroidota bacterium]
MSISRWFIVITYTALLLLPLTVSAQQSRKELEKKRKQKEQEIKLTKKILDQTRTQKKKTLNELNLLDKQIKVREELIGTISDEIVVVDGQITVENATLEQLGHELKRLKDEYADMVYRAYKMRESGDLASYVLSSDNFNQAVKRIKYVQQVSEDRERQLVLIKHMQDSITGKITKLKEIKREKNELLGQKETENNELKVDVKETQQLVKTLQQKEKELKDEIKQKEKSAKQLDYQIRKLIQEEIKEPTGKGKGKDKDKNKPEDSKKKGEMELTPAGAALAKNFSANKGKLPWPTETGIVVGKFGTYAHPELKNITIENNGVDIATVKGSKARCVFEGEVRSVFSIPGMQKAVMVKHGNYFTVYTHLDQVLVNRGDKVKVKQELGIIYHDTEEGKTVLHFEVWQNSNNLNPESWLADK